MKKALALLSAAVMTLTAASCGSGKKKSSSSSKAEGTTAASAEATAAATPAAEATTAVEPTTVHVSPKETLSATISSQVTVNKTIERTEGSNTIKLPLSDFIEDGDVITSFTFTIYSDDGANIGTFKGGCGLSVSSECSSATDEGWYQSEDFSAETEGTYGEITWNVPADVGKCAASGGEVLFGYWWGNAASIRIESAVCTFTRTREISVDGTVDRQVGKSVGFSDTDNTIKVPTDFLPDGAVPEAVIYNVSSSGGFGKFTGAFGYSSSKGNYQSGDTAVFTDSANLSLTWFVPDEAKQYAAKDGEIMLGYWWSEQPTVDLDSITVKYSLGSGASAADSSAAETEEKTEAPTAAPVADTSGFRSSAEIVDAINVGWNLGNTFDSYGYADYATDGETAWGNPKTTKAMIDSVKNAGFNAIRIPVTWGEHMNGDTIDSAWLDRVHEVVDYAYNNGMFVIINMHHDDYTWFNPTEAEYSQDSAKLKKIWEQLSARFKFYGDRLLFEGMNEPRTIGSANEWMGGTPEERKVINKYAQDFVDTVRASGGNNTGRTLIVTTYGASAEDAALNDMVIPSGENIVLNVHYYAPWKFANGESSTFGDAEKSELSAKFSTLKSKFIDNGTPVIIDEFGAVANADESERAEFYRYYVSQAKANGIKCFVWDNNVASGESSYGIFDRGTLAWNKSILDSIMSGIK